jgi:O-antigen biosynthesis protein
MPFDLRALAARVRDIVRRWPLAHAVMHGAAVGLTRTPWGERFVRSVVSAEALTDKQYRAWAQAYDTLTDDDRTAIGEHIARMASPPLISVILPAYATPLPLLRAAIASVRNQLYPHWELCIADDGSPGEDVWRELQVQAAGDPRIKIVRRPTNGHISAATNSALALASGAFVAFLDHDDLLTEHALYLVAAEIEAHPDAELIYSDEDKIDAHGLRSQPYFKTDWNPELMLGQNMVNHLAVYRRATVEAVGGLREGFEGAQDHDLALRVAERTSTDQIRHIPYILYHWRWQGAQGSFSRGWADRCAEARRRAVAEHLARTGQAAEVNIQPGDARALRVRRVLPDSRPPISVIIPTRDRADLLRRAVDGVLNQSAYAPLDLTIIDNGSVEPATEALFEALRTDPRVRILAAPGLFNFAALMNRAVTETTGDLILLLNNDISVITPDWLDELAAQALRPNVGAVGAKLFYPDGSLQHAGVVLGVGAGPKDERVAGHLYTGARGGHAGYQGHLAVSRNVSAVTAACLMMRREVWDQVGGMDAESLAVAFNDVDLCLKIRAAGYDIVWTPFAELFHHESASRGSDLTPEAARRFAGEVQVMRQRWGAVLDNDPFYGGMFDPGHTNYRPAAPPVRRRPWKM